MEWTARCEGIARAAAAGFYWPGAERDDVIQEARIGVWQALDAFRPGAGREFAAFATLLANRRLQDAVTAGRRRKHRVLSEALSFELPTGRGEELEDLGRLEDVLPIRPQDDPAAVVIRLEEVRELVARWRRLTPWERECARRVMFGGEDYAAIGPKKSVDNAMQRARAKLRPAA